VRLVVLASIAWCAAARVAHADPVTATRLAGEADALVADGKLVEAAEKFRAAFAEDARPEHICNAGVAYYKAVDLVRAHHFLDRCVAVGVALDRAFIANVRTVISAVEDALATGAFTPIDLHVEPATTSVTFVEGPFGEPIIGASRVWLAPGTYRLTLRAEGYVDRRVDIDASRPHVPVDVREKLERVPLPTPPAPTLPPAPTRKTAWKAAAYGVSAGTLLSGGTALVFYLAAVTKANAASNEQTDRMKHDSLASTAQNWQHASWITGGMFGVGAVASALLWYRTSRVVVAPAHDGVAIAVTGRF
jgi:hypothetical protein